MRCSFTAEATHRQNPGVASRTLPTRPVCPLYKAYGQQNSVASQRESSLVARASKYSKAAAEGMIAQVAQAVVSKDDLVSRQFALQAAEVVDEAKCQDIRVLHVAPFVSWTSFMVFATVFSRPQLLAAIARLERMVDEEHPDRERQNQPGTSPWECLDYGDVVVHLFTDEQRKIYDVEGFYAQAPDVPLPWNQLPGSQPGDAAPTWTKQY